MLHTHRSSNRAYHGFTLVELLVVIGIIAILVGILLPTLGRAKSSANSVKCAANLKTLGTALQLYVGQSKGMLPYGYVENGDVIQGNPRYLGPNSDWTVLLLDVINKKGGDYNSQDRTGIGDAGLRAIFLCPESYLPSGGKAFITNYSAHPRILPNLTGADSYAVAVLGVPGNPLPRLQTYKLARIRNPAEKMVIFDASLSNSTWQAQACASQLDRAALAARLPFLTDNWARNPSLNASQPVDLRSVEDGATLNDINKDNAKNPGNVRFRHIKDTKMNGLMLDGHVETFTYNPRTQSSDLLRKHIYITPPR